MTGRDAARTWACIFAVLKSEFPDTNWHWDTERLESITTTLTIAIINQPRG